MMLILIPYVLADVTQMAMNSKKKQKDLIFHMRQTDKHEQAGDHSTAVFQIKNPVECSYASVLHALPGSVKRSRFHFHGT
jgi:hypothetical protein